VEGAFYLCYLGGGRQSARWTIDLPEDVPFTIEVIDTWEMTRTQLECTYSGRCEIPLPGKPSMALRICKAHEAGCDG
jgi:hypothetical protein